MKTFFFAFFYDPLYNLLVWLTETLPGADVGLAIIVLTIIVRLLLLPLYLSAQRTQAALKNVEKEIKEIKEKIKDRKEQGEALIRLYRDNGISPLSGFITLLIQIPIVLALFFVAKDILVLDPSRLYYFVPVPEAFSTNLFGLVDITARNLFLAILVGWTQYAQTVMTLPALSDKRDGSFKDELARSMHLQMKYVLPVIIVFAAAALPAAVSLYWLTGNCFGIVTELVRRQLKKPNA